MKENIFDIYELPSGHEERFLEKLSKINPDTRKKKFFPQIVYWGTSIAATLIIAFLVIQRKDISLEDVSQEAYQSEQYYLPMIQENINIIKNNAEDEKFKQQALIQLAKMNADYQSIRKEIIEKGQNNQLLNAMVMNFDTQLEFSNNIIVMIN